MQKSYIYWPYLKELDTTITRVFKEEDAFFVELEKTLFYPHLAGGQPEDRGTIDGIRVLHVRENAGVIEHQVEEEMQEGPATLQLDWERRFDHMQQHTAQHILSGIFEQLFGIHTVGFMIGESISTIDIDALGRHNAKEIIESVEGLANRLTRAALPVHRSFEKSASKSAPKSASAPTRLIHIPTIETTKCGGTHVANTSECAPIRITRIQKDRGHIRLTYLAGGRCFKEYDALRTQAQRLAERFNTSTAEVFARIDSQLDRIDHLSAQNKNLLKVATDAIRPTLATSNQSHRGYQALVQYIPAPIALKELAKDLSQEIILLVNSEGALYFRMSKAIDPLANFMRTLKADPNFRGGGSGTEWYGQFAEGPYEPVPDALWKEMKNAW